MIPSIRDDADLEAQVYQRGLVIDSQQIVKRVLVD